MQSSTRTFVTPDGVEVFLRHWQPDEGQAVRGVVQVVHGLAEHCARYERFAQALTAAGWAVMASDHRGHGKTARSPDELGHFADHDGWTLVIEDLLEVGTIASAAHPGVPLVLFGHSMGSTLALGVLAHPSGQDVHGLILSGPAGQPPPLALAGRYIALAERLRIGKRGRSWLLTRMSFGDFNKPFEPARTEFDWLSRDPVEVDKYIADPLCGFMVTTQHWRDHLDALIELRTDAFLRRLPPHVPLLFVAGGDDPVGGMGSQVRAFVARLRGLGRQGIEDRIWDKARHELLNDLVRDEVTSTVLDWLDRKVPARG
jgi:alpha-beta hydrolase superfamily lysophospholipase